MACDTVGTMLKMLKREKVLTYNQAFLMYPLRKAEGIELLSIIQPRSGRVMC